MLNLLSFKKVVKQYSKYESSFRIEAWGSLQSTHENKILSYATSYQLQFNSKPSSKKHKIVWKQKYLCTLCIQNRQPREKCSSLSKTCIRCILFLSICGQVPQKRCLSSTMGAVIRYHHLFIINENSWMLSSLENWTNYLGQ